MTSQEYLALLGRLQMTGAECMDLLGYSRNAHYTWAKNGPPPAAAILLTIMERTGLTVEDIRSILASSID